jgi:hypothetical protein
MPVGKPSLSFDHRESHLARPEVLIVREELSSTESIELVFFLFPRDCSVSRAKLAMSEDRRY